MTASFERLSREDARILALERGTIRGHTCKVVVVGPSADGQAPNVEAIRARVEGALGAVPRLRQRIMKTPLRAGAPVWIDDADFDIRRHVVAVTVDAPVDPGRLRLIVAEVMARRLDPRRPLWRIDVVAPLAEGRVALVVRLHHAMADGVTAVRILGRVLFDSEDGSAENADRAGAPAPWRPAPPPSARRLLVMSALERARGAARTARSAPRAAATAVSGAGASIDRLRATARRELGRGGSPSPLAAPIGPRREVAFASAPLERVREIGHAAAEGVTVNDVVLAVVAAGLRRWLEHEGTALAGLRVKVPVSLHGHDARAEQAGNRDSFMLVDLPLEEPDPLRRLLAINAETRERKLQHDAETVDAFFRDVARVSTSLERVVERWAMDPRLFTLAVSNVPGPREAVTVAGAPLLELYSLAEVANRHALRASVISAAGMLFFGLCADAAVVDRIDLITAGMEQELTELAASTGVEEPGPEPEGPQL